MTEYGRSPGSEPWHPTDPLYGDQGWEGQQQYQHPQQASQYGQGGGQGYEDAPYQQHPQQQYQQQYEQQQYQEQQYQDPQQHQGYVDPQYQQQMQPQQYQQYQQHPQQHQQQYGTGYPGGYDTPGNPGQQYDGSWESGQAAMAYGGPPADPYGGQNPDLYGTPQAYPPPQPPGHRQNPPEPVIDWAPEEEARPEPEEEQHPFFTGADDSDDKRGKRDERDEYDEYDEYEDEPAPGRGSRGGDRERRSKAKKRKGKNGMACLVVAAVLVGGVGGIGYFGYQFWQGQFAAAPDYAGAGSGEVQVEIPKDSGGYQIGNILKKAGVVKSVDAFVSAQGKNPKGLSIQAGVYTLKKEMSAESAVSLMLDPVSQSNFVLPPGQRNAWVYAQLDKRLDLKPGTSKEIAFTKADSLGLPDWAKNHEDVKDPLEGFLFPATYPVAKGAKPEDVLRKMVSRSNAEYLKLDLDAKAKELGLKGPWDLVTVASLVQAEGKTHEDFRKMAEVVYNRLKPEYRETVQLLQFDSTLNYLKGQSEIKISEQEANTNTDPYNTYKHKGLPPGPIGNPGNEALASMLNPTSDGWLYFVATDGMNKTEFAKTHAEFLKLKDKFNASTNQ
ncbi:endolytic transglycosylase MltG [Streptomyces gardneri]|uniref:endolytic transglycosylase MltG n=1 Tax=Streptomyces gardneri TaxID=66892 RepID=UPI0006E23DE9|nr:endolytic transglycosylase MltG [Streptomyces gardneri]QPK44447.1 endolytic transglycosylase MltG [Streptomyces gardneri]WRK35744.1 endolytic transglycosylase MltG [Streptomyces venezuelae]